MQTDFWQFAKIMEVFNKYGVNFVSVTQQFSTIDSAGRMMLNILMTFSQFELQKLMKERSRREGGNHGRVCKSPFQHILRCGHCDGPMGATYTAKRNGRNYSYYLCMKDHKRAKSICPVKRVPTGDLEKAVLDQLGAVFRTPTMVADVYFRVKKQEEEERRVMADELAEVERQLADQKLNQDIPGMRETAKKLIPLKKQLREWDDAVATEEDIFTAFEDIQSLWDHLFPLEKEELIKLLIQKIEVRDDGIDIEFKADAITSLVSELTAAQEE